MNIQVKNTIKPIDYLKSIKILEKRANDVLLGKKDEFLWIIVLNLNKRGKDIRKLVSNIENCIIEILKEYNIKSYADSKNVGVWVGKKENSKKIAAIGVRVKKWLAYHGFSLNVSTDLSKYSGIVPCGIKDKGITSLKELGVKNYDDIDKIIIKKFLNIFL